MRKFNKKFMYDGFMDDECLDLCNAMNALPGIETTESCWGHGGSPFRIYFKVKEGDHRGLFFLTRCVDHRYWKYGYLWKIKLTVGDQYDADAWGTRFPITYILTSEPITGEDAYLQALDLVRNMNDHLNHENFLKLYELNINDFDIYEENN